jgi:GAF domain-containing protein
MRLGERLSGWVASSREGPRNADARLDLHETTLRAAISTPIVDGDRLVGVMTLYGRNPDSFTLDSFDVLDALVSAMSLARPTRGAHLTLAAPVRQSA